LVQAVCVFLAAAAFDATPWLYDLRQLTSEISGHYANLDWAVEHRRMDLPKLREGTEARLRASTSEQEARSALQRFVDVFGDGHLTIEWPKPEPPSATPPAPSLCARLGYRRPSSAGIDFSQIAGFTPLEGEPFPHALLRLDHHRTLGVLRIAAFSERSSPEVCEDVLREMQIDTDAPCDSSCADSVELASANRLTSEIDRRARNLKARGATAILVDITRNGGGSNWVEAATRILSRVPLPEPRLAFLKHPHWMPQLEQKLRDVEADLQAARGPRAMLEEAAARLRRGIAATREPCDRSDVWVTGKIGCAMLVPDVLFTDGVVAHALPSAFAGLASRTTLFHPLRYAYTENADRLPLYVVVDRHTWSAAEYFAAILQDNRAAVVVGELTGGAGCGYTEGGIPAVLSNSGAKVRMPDCVRLRKDGSDEVAGVTPDVLVPWATWESPFTKADKLLRALSRKQAKPRSQRAP
jgi:hypothetical protein